MSGDSDLSRKSLYYLEGCLSAGWNPIDIDRLRSSLYAFEMVASEHPLEDAVAAMAPQPHPSHLPWLETLHQHIQILYRAQLAADLASKAQKSGRDSLQAHALILEKHGQIKSGDRGKNVSVAAPTSIIFEAAPARSEIQVTRGTSTEASSE